MVENSPKKMEIQALVVVWHVQTVSSWMPLCGKKHICVLFLERKMQITGS